MIISPEASFSKGVSLTDQENQHSHVLKRTAHTQRRSSVLVALTSINGVKSQKPNSLTEATYLKLLSSAAQRRKSSIRRSVVKASILAEIEVMQKQQLQLRQLILKCRGDIQEETKRKDTLITQLRGKIHQAFSFNCNDTMSDSNTGLIQQLQLQTYSVEKELHHRALDHFEFLEESDSTVQRLQEEIQETKASLFDWSLNRELLTKKIEEELNYREVLYSQLSQVESTATGLKQFLAGKAEDTTHHTSEVYLTVPSVDDSCGRSKLLILEETFDNLLQFSEKSWELYNQQIQTTRDTYESELANLREMVGRRRWARSKCSKQSTVYRNYLRQEVQECNDMESMEDIQVWDALTLNSLPLGNNLCGSSRALTTKRSAAPQFPDIIQTNSQTGNSRCTTPRGTASDTTLQNNPIEQQSPTLSQTTKVYQIKVCSATVTLIQEPKCQTGSSTGTSCLRGNTLRLLGVSIAIGLLGVLAYNKSR